MLVDASQQTHHQISPQHVGKFEWDVEREDEEFDIEERQQPWREEVVINIISTPRSNIRRSCHWATGIFNFSAIRLTHSFVPFDRVLGIRELLQHHISVSPLC